VHRDRSGRALRGRALLGRLLGGLGPEPRRVGIEAENDLRLAFLDPRGEPCAEGSGARAD
jgi:hypothetical protein